MHPGSGFSGEELERYARQLVLPGVGVEGQQRLKAARVLCVGAGGLGSPASLYLAAAGVGTIGLVDSDRVSLSNLQRQVLYGTPEIGAPKTAPARVRLEELNPHVSVEPHQVALAAGNAVDLLGRYDIVLDCSDNFPTRYLINDTCVLLDKPDVFGAVFMFEGQMSVFGRRGGPCYRCVFPEPPPPEIEPSCADSGILGALPGVIGAIQAAEAIKLITGVGEPLVGRMIVCDALAMTFRELGLPRNPRCAACGERPAGCALP
ncbi:MAG TPA: molybdopterin-synthase adenylyltransferase MoeB [Vicinamibacterales bacterium]|nr:molybdopterin-synthase adenylyltransferase MoeB [Vicinamibacterales bacterium]HOQ59526.1 molybdopterin-synthase adenylyltransferase MoeB [Vicinamibacterales bacterium]HPK72880.1 molybdopterin-synthase adenylyltransferase MoeB [Vicinamibacterales bacterium]